MCSGKRCGEVTYFEKYLLQNYVSKIPQKLVNKFTVSKIAG